MKARIILLTITTAALIAAPGLVFAQQGPGGGGEGPHGPGGPDGFMGGGPGHHLLRLLPRLADRLELTETQRDQIRAIVEAQQPAMEALRDEASTARDAFHETYDIGDYDEAAFRAFFESQAEIHVEMKLQGAATVSQVWGILTSEQQEQILDLIELFRDGRGSGKRHGGGRHGGN